MLHGFPLVIEIIGFSLYFFIVSKCSTVSIQYFYRLIFLRYSFCNSEQSYPNFTVEKHLLGHGPLYDSYGNYGPSPWKNAPELSHTSTPHSASLWGGPDTREYPSLPVRDRITPGPATTDCKLTDNIEISIEMCKSQMEAPKKMPRGQYWLCCPNCVQGRVLLLPEPRSHCRRPVILGDRTVLGI